MSILRINWKERKTQQAGQRDKRKCLRLVEQRRRGVPLQVPRPFHQQDFTHTQDDLEVNMRYLSSVAEPRILINNLDPN